MTKIVILFAVALTTLQGSYQLSQISSRQTELQEVVEELAQTAIHVKNISAYITGHLSSVNRDYEHKIYDTVEERNIKSLHQKHQDAIHKVESNFPDNSQCIKATRSKTLLATLELKTGVLICINEGRDVVTEIRSTLKTLDEKAVKIDNELSEGFHACLISHEVVKCIRDIIDPIKAELPVLDQQVKDTDYLVHKKVIDGNRNLNICLQKAEHDFSLKSNTILEDLDKCIESDARFFNKYDPKGIMDIIRELKEKIEYIMHILSHLPTSIAEIPEKISEIISHLNIAILVSRVKDEINDIINDGGSNAESCRPMADERTDALVETSEATANQCIEDAESKVDEVKANISALADEAKQILTDIKDQTVQCFLENKLNPVQFYKCLERHVGEFQKRIEDLEQNVSETYENSKNQADEIIKSLAQCVNKVQMDTIRQGQVIIKDVENCVRHSHPMFFM